MMSKKSYFSPTIFWKDVRVCWPLWSLYILGLLALMPIHLLMRFLNNEKYEEAAAFLNLESLRNCVNPNYVIAIVFVMALVFGLVLYSYLNTSRCAYMLHSLPLCRMQLLITKIVTGLVMLILPLLIMFLISTLICISYHVTAIMVLMQWFFVGAGTAFVAFSMVSFCAFLAGHGVAMTFYFILINVIYPIAHFIFKLFISFFGFGISSNTFETEIGEWSFLCPVWQMIKDLDMQTTIRSGAIVRLEIIGWKVLAGYMVFAVILYLLCAIMYKKRKLEYAGDMVAIRFVRPVVRWLVGWIVGALMAYIIYLFFTIGSKKLGIQGLLISMLLFGFIGFMASQMIIKKSFRVFRKKFWLEGACFLIFCCAFFFGTIGVAHFNENFVPDYEDVKYAKITFSYPLYCYDEEIKFVAEIQHELTENKEEIDAARVPTTDNYMNIKIMYQLKNGKTIERDYSIAVNKISKKIAAKIEDEEWKTSNFKEGFFPKIQDGSGSIYSANMELYDLNSDSYYSTTEMLQYDRIFCADMYSAILKDMENYSLQKYNITTSYSDEHKNDELGKFLSPISISYYTTLEEEPKLGDEYYDKSWNYGEGEFFFMTDLYFGKDCENIIQCLLDYNVIFSVDELVSWEDYNAYWYGYSTNEDEESVDYDD